VFNSHCVGVPLPWDDLCKSFCARQRMAKVPNAVEILPNISTAWVGRTSVRPTADRQTDDRRTGDSKNEIANVNVSSRSLKSGWSASKLQCATFVSFLRHSVEIARNTASLQNRQNNLHISHPAFYDAALYLRITNTCYQLSKYCFRVNYVRLPTVQQLQQALNRGVPKMSRIGE